MRKILFFLFLIPTLVKSQPIGGLCPPNLDYELGSLANWQSFTGSASSGDPITPGQIAGRHTIVSANDGTDLYGGFPQLCPFGGQYSLRLGNSFTGNQAEKVVYNFTVPLTPSNNFSLTYFYAAVLENPVGNAHTPAQRPKLKVTCTDATTGNPVGCATYEFVADAVIPGFFNSPANPNVKCKDWTPNTIDFSGLAGTQVRLEFATFDCTLGGHFGYAFVDVATSCTSVLATGSVCQGGGGELILNAPSGFQSYAWWDATYTTLIGTTQNILINPSPAIGTVFNVDMVPYPGYGCRDTSTAVVTLIAQPDTPAAQILHTYCQNQSAPQLTATALPGNFLQWYTSSTGGTPSLIAPVPVTNAPGTFFFYVSQENPQGCEGPRTRIRVVVSPTPTAVFTINDDRQCVTGNLFTFTNNSTDTVPGLVSYEWDFGDASSINPTTANASHVFTDPGNYNVRLRVQNPPNCQSNTFLPVTVVAKPIAQFSLPDTICENSTLVTLVESSYTPTTPSTITGWEWNINGSTQNVQIPPSFTRPAGDLNISLVATNADACKSDTARITKQVKHNPVAKFDYTRIQCENESILFTDQSFIPNAFPGENIRDWNWVFSNGTTSTTPTNQLYFTAGPNNAELQVTTNFGCTSIIADSNFLIQLKPEVGIIINDSCVNRPISFTAVDINNSVSNWRWNFGNGFYQAPNVITKTFTGDMYKPFTIIGESVFGCKDTLFVPFRTYASRARAGNDTLVARNQPVQLNASGGDTYIWSPATGLTNAFIANPVAIYDQDLVYQLQVISKEGCESYDQVLIRRYKGPELYVPTAFTPNGDGKNDILKVFPVGIRSFTSFEIYNRAGQRIFYTNNANIGWDGSFKGRAQDGGTYIFVARAIDYLGNPMENKSTLILIR